MNGFHEVRLPDWIVYGTKGGPEYNTTINETAGGWEQRNGNWSRARGRWQVGNKSLTLNEGNYLQQFFRARRGKLFAFRWHDFTDDSGTAQVIGTGDGTTLTYQLIKIYQDEAGVEVKYIYKPITGTVSIYLNGVKQNSGWSVSITTGLVTFVTPPGNGVAVTADYQYDVPVRFDTDILDITLEYAEPTTKERAFSLGNLPLIEVRL